MQTNDSSCADSPLSAASLPPLGSDGTLADAATLDAVDAVSANIHANVQAARSQMEHGVLAVGESIERVVDTTRQYESEVRQSLEGLQSEGGLGSLLVSIQGAMGQFDETLQADLGGLQSNIDEARLLAKAISTVGARIDEISMSTRVLAVNARLEAARSSDGESFGVIADEMRVLNQQVQSANTEMKAVAQRLQELLPHISQTCGGVKTRATTLNTSLTEYSRGALDEESKLRSALETTLDVGKRRVGEICAESMSAATLLAFHDPTAKALAEVDGHLGRLRRILVEGPGAEAEEVHEESDSEDIASGELLLF